MSEEHKGKLIIIEGPSQKKRLELVEGLVARGGYTAVNGLYSERLDDYAVSALAYLSDVERSVWFTRLTRSVVEQSKKAALRKAVGEVVLMNGSALSIKALLGTCISLGYLVDPGASIRSIDRNGVIAQWAQMQEVRLRHSLFLHEVKDYPYFLKAIDGIVLVEAVYIPEEDDDRPLLPGIEGIILEGKVREFSETFEVPAQRVNSFRLRLDEQVRVVDEFIASI